MSSSNFFICFFTYVKISKDSSAKYYQNDKERLQKSCERYQSLRKEEKEKKKRRYGRK